jgi:hypothetical protein
MFIPRIKSGAWKRFVAGTLCAASLATVNASDWTRFRGPNGTGISPDADPLPRNIQ